MADKRDQVLVRASAEFLALLDEWCAQQRPIATRATAMRFFAERGLHSFLYEHVPMAQEQGKYHSLNEAFFQYERNKPDAKRTATRSKRRVKVATKQRRSVKELLGG